MREYFFNFFLWYYFVKVRRYFTESVSLRFIFQLNRTNTLPMARNFSKPLFQDDSSLGKNLGYIIRFFWVGFGTLYCLLLIIPWVIFGVVLIVLPLIPIIQIVAFIVNKV